MNILNTAFIEQLYEAWRADPQSVSAEWQKIFISFSSEESNTDDAPAVPSEKKKQDKNYELSTDIVMLNKPAQFVGHTYLPSTTKQTRVDALIWGHREVGALYAQLNPLQAYETPEMRYMRITVEGASVRRLSPEYFGLNENDMKTVFYTGQYIQPDRLPLKDILRRLHKTYLSTFSAEFLHIKNRSMSRWLLKKIEGEEQQWSHNMRIRFQKDLIKAEEFEHFVHSNFIGQKRFSLEGSEGLIPAVHYLIYSATEYALQEIVLGMAHRGRLNIFTNALRKPALETFSKFIDVEQPHVYGGTGDVKYHLGHSFDYQDKRTGRAIHISLVANPSHLEAVNAVVQGKARGIQRRRKDYNRKKVVPVLIHGDAAFTGQGVVAETFNLSQLKGYRTGGTIHIIINNQIGFTTASRNARSTFFATDLAKSMQVPIFHANGDDPEAVVRAMNLAIRWRQKFGYDAVVDIVCYRRLGHNEADEPSYTHPIMYKLIQKRPSAPVLYGKKIAAENIWSLEKQDEFRKRYRTVLKAQLSQAKRANHDSSIADAFQGGEWKKFSYAGDVFTSVKTAISKKQMQMIGKSLTTIPEDFHVHPKLKRLLAGRKKMIDEGAINWGLAEALAMGSLLIEGYPIRLSGEDSGRGTFSHRHAVWWDVQTETPRQYVPLQHITANQADFSVYDSPLSEFGVLAFDYGYSIAQPNILVMWEAQFGDFVNGAQVVIDQFISSSESKWFRSSGIVMLLPHGYEGQGPEHSSAHLERFLQLCAGNNMQIVNATLPAQFFHVLRRQMHQPFRKPLVVMSPKSLLRHKAAKSHLTDFTSGGFSCVLKDPLDLKNPHTLVFCCGKIYYDLDAYRQEHKIKDVAIVRIEQLYPWPKEQIQQVAALYGTPKRVVWAQEESQNRGAWSFVRYRLATLLKRNDIEYIGRMASASPATGSYNEHVEELQSCMEKLFAPVPALRKKQNG